MRAERAGNPRPSYQPKTVGGTVGASTPVRSRQAAGASYAVKYSDDDTAHVKLKSELLDELGIDDEES